jgi:hypothetical protein
VHRRALPGNEQYTSLVNARSVKRIGVLWRADLGSRLEESRYQPVGEALMRRGLDVEGVPFSEEAVDAIRKQLLGLDGVLVWVDPISDGRDRLLLDPLLRVTASQGVWVSAHPDVILKMGTKDVLVKTSHMTWGTDCHLYHSPEEMTGGLISRLALGPRVFKQHRGNGGNGVWKVELHETRGPGPESAVQVLHAQRGSSLEDMQLQQFVQQSAVYFAGNGCMIDQPYQPRLADGMIRCYLSENRVVGFGHQFVTALLPPPEGTRESPPPSPRLYYGPDKAEFQAIRAKLEERWVEEMQDALDLTQDQLPALWDADFLYGPKDATGADTYVLCEINVSCVSPFPDEALEPLAEAVARALAAA